MMNRTEKLKSIFKDGNEIAKTCDVKQMGFSNDEIARLCNEGILTRIKHGYYSLGDRLISDEQVISTLLPDVILCLETALFYHGYSDYAPRTWNIAVPRTFSRTKLKFDSLFIKTKFVKTDLFELGKTKMQINGFELNVYDKERTICDCFKYKNQIDREIFNKAVNAYIADDKKNLANLSNYSKQMRVYKKVAEIMEVLLNG